MSTQAIHLATAGLSFPIWKVEVLRLLLRKDDREVSMCFRTSSTNLDTGASFQMTSRARRFGVPLQTHPFAGTQARTLDSAPPLRGAPAT